MAILGFITCNVRYSLKSLWNLILKIDPWTLYFNTSSIVNFCHFLELDSIPRIVENTNAIELHTARDRRSLY